jgi:diguanylate cyclase (GGDEF)-like protein/PAS domain S-box-containing protein
MLVNFAVLVISESPDRRKKITRLLENTDVRLSEADSSASAISLLKKNVFDIIISDTNIGQLDGWRLARMVRAKLFQCPPQTPFILITDTYCEHIAETTASAFSIDKVIGQAQLDILPEVLAELFPLDLRRNNYMSVLVVEDDGDIAELAERILAANYNVEIANTGRKGLECYQQGIFDIVLLDVQLPEMSGAEVLREIMQHNPKQAVVIMTAHGGTDLAEELMIAGAVDFIPKPFKADQLRRVMAIAAHRENYLISNSQFEEKVLTIQSREEQYRQLSEKHTRLLNHLSSTVMEFDMAGIIRFINQAWSNLSGYSDEETLGQNLQSFTLKEDAQSAKIIANCVNNLIKGEYQHKKIEFQLRHKSGQPLWVEAHFNDLNKANKIVGVTATIDNINERKKAEAELNYLASHDTLTGLFNRHYFDNELIRLAALSQKNGTIHSLLYLDLDHFKTINDTQGHQQGDIILKDVAKRIKKLKRDADVFCRLGGDEFALLLPRTNKAKAQQVAQNICDMLQQGHYQYEERIYKISGSVGVTEINGDEELPETYLQQADISLYVAKRRGRNLVHVYSKEDKDSENFQVSLHWVHTLQKAIINDQLILHFQPVIDASTREVEYFEALVRLQIDNKLIMPGEFIPALERIEDINMLDHQVISKAIAMMSQHSSLKKVAINLSAQAFSDERLLPLIEAKLSEFSIRPEQIIFEVTESASLTNLAATQFMINRLMDIGCEFSIDDFGTGFSTFNYLKQLPANCIKVDGSFVKDMIRNPIDKALVRAICEVAKALNKTTVAEFVEDEATLIALRDMGVDYMQGYHIDRPMDILSLEQKYR